MEKITTPVCSEAMSKYFEDLTIETTRAYELAGRARAQGFDPEEKVDIPLARNMAERVEGLVSAAAPQLVGKGIPQRIQELETKYGVNDLRVSCSIAEDVAREKFCVFKDKKEAMEVGIRVGFAYDTNGIVSAPLEGFVELLIKKRKDGKEYFAMSYAGPVRGAGGTQAARSLIIADYVRTVMGYAPYDPDEQEINRFYVELEDYHERVTNLQYRPSEREIKALVKAIPVEVTGDPTEKLDVSNYKDLPRIPTNKIRGGMCLVISMLALKAPKLWNDLKKWGDEFGLHWEFLSDFLKLQKEIKSGNKSEKHSTEEKKATVLPDNTFIVDLVGGRPVLTHPLAHGGFRLRYGRSRMGGYSASSIHPATMAVLDDYVAIGTQLKVERPGKAAAITVCDLIEGPVVLLTNGDVVRLDNRNEAKRINSTVKEILYLGDMLFSYGDFFDRAHPLVPAGYCEEWYIQELEKAAVDMFGTLDTQKLAEFLEIAEEDLEFLLKHPLETRLSARAAIVIAEKLNIPLHPRYTYHWNILSAEDIEILLDLLQLSKFDEVDTVLQKLIIPITIDDKRKRLLELLGVPHTVAIEDVVVEKEDARALTRTLGITKESYNNKSTFAALKQKLHDNKEKPVLEILSALSGITIRDKSGTFIGARMGRPEKAKMRKLIGAPHVLFPVGEEGGRMRSFQAVLEAGKIRAEFPLRYCDSCKKEIVFNICDACGKKAERRFFCNTCGIQMKDTCAIHGKNRTYVQTEVDFKSIYENVLKLLNLKIVPDLIKGVKGTSNKDHLPEHFAKGILRAHHNVAVNKDGTTRYDMSEVPITHFKPKEVGTSLEKLRELGYNLDIHAKPLVDEDQILELKPQDLILPGGHDTLDGPATDVLANVARFVDNLLVSLYGLEPYYNIEKPNDLIGHLVIGLAPHISAGTVGRIIGFSQTAGMLAHPLYHAAMRRDCDGDESCVMLLMDALLNFSRQYLPDNRGGRTMDAPLVLTAILNPAEVDDMVQKLDIVWRYPLALYEAALRITPPSEIDIQKLGGFLGTARQYEGMGFTHDVSNINEGSHCSAYKTLPTIEEKLKGQMELARKIRAVNTSDVARLVIEKHFMKDTRGNLRKFSMQKFRCSNCNESFRRTPLIGKCTKCGGKLIFTISEGSIVKYLEPSISLAENFDCDEYLKDSLYLIKHRLESMFEKDKEKQLGLGAWFSA
jgi:DNA polymerase II large subunit